jgi:hypothetical protein
MGKVRLYDQREGEREEYGYPRTSASVGIHPTSIK